MRIGSNASWRMNASIFFMSRAPPWTGRAGDGMSRDPRGAVA